MSTNKEILAFNEDIGSAARFYMQHWMWVSETGFLIHPHVPLNRENLKIADIACGTGIWLVDLAKKVPETSQLDGFDISSAHFPPREWLPQNINLSILDASAPLLDQLVGKYDIVHIGRIVFFIRNEDPSIFLKNFIKLLKPGGYLCWDELDAGAMRPVPVSSSVQHPFCDKMDRFGRAWFTAHGLSSNWVGTLDKTLQDFGLEVIDFKRIPISNAMAKPWTITQLMATQDFIENDIIPSCEGKEGRPSAEEWREMVRNVIAECQKGVKLAMDIVYVVGKTHA
ncbi:S-adenosyl-L-methionine-dependent methyltransferase [Massarina eburnea CBS 473.64]|uniref:S-adenosyl-L-methionine-dependent methyltransferase n=1 Tax=Massarina eburnea CBS 473.64 TaxID=1395130 RepID=A0A6A6S1J2_9PLEO|nr:S-adenosyl-L-methionine-dependent methyltransferase [Massarina eburnea CBS 473.64]